MDATTIYTKSNCRACKITKRMLEDADVPFDVIDIEQTEGAADFVRQRGFRAAPVVLSPVGDWAGLDEQMISDLIRFETGRPN